MQKYSVQPLANGAFSVLLFGRSHGTREYSTWEEAEEAIRTAEESERQSDEDQARFARS